MTEHRGQELPNGLHVRWDTVDQSIFSPLLKKFKRQNNILIRTDRCPTTSQVQHTLRKTESNHTALSSESPHTKICLRPLP